jgi:hypothetical protein
MAKSLLRRSPLPTPVERSSWPFGVRGERDVALVEALR